MVYTGYTKSIPVPMFSDLERDYARRENIRYKQLATFVTTTQLLAKYFRAKPNNTIGK